MKKIFWPVSSLALDFKFVCRGKANEFGSEGGRFETLICPIYISSDFFSVSRIFCLINRHSLSSCHNARSSAFMFRPVPLWKLHYICGWYSYVKGLNNQFQLIIEILLQNQYICEDQTLLDTNILCIIAFRIIHFLL